MIRAIFLLVGIILLFLGLRAVKREKKRQEAYLMWLFSFFAFVVGLFPFENFSTWINDQNETQPEIVLNQERLDLEVGSTYQLSLEDSSLFSEQDLQWVSADPEIVEVGDSGSITAMSAGTTTISAMIEYQGVEYTDMCIVVATQAGSNGGESPDFNSPTPASPMMSEPSDTLDNAPTTSTNISSAPERPPSQATTTTKTPSIVNTLAPAQTPATTPTPTPAPTPTQTPAEESELSIVAFQATGDSVRGAVYLKFHITSNYYLLDGNITLYPGGDAEPIQVAYHTNSSQCTSTSSATNFAIGFSEMVSGETYEVEITASDISGKTLSKTISFTAY